MFTAIHIIATAVLYFKYVILKDKFYKMQKKMFSSYYSYPQKGLANNNFVITQISDYEIYTLRKSLRNNVNVDCIKHKVFDVKYT